jgi:hypothetical protein
MTRDVGCISEYHMSAGRLTDIADDRRYYKTVDAIQRPELLFELELVLSPRRDYERTNS